jgi:hypothetical protein
MTTGFTSASPSLAPAEVPMTTRVRTGGKFLWAGGHKLYVRGVTYGTFRPNSVGDEFPEPARIRDDIAMMAEHGINAVRTYTPPPIELLDAARAHGLRVLVGLGAERLVGYLNDGRRRRPDEWLVPGLRRCVGHPAVLGYAVGNEIPAATVRWLGRRKVERHIERLSQHVRACDPGALVTYVNYPTTEYLELPFLDFVSFNVYLESEERLDSYLARLQNLAGDRPLLMAEIGLDSFRHGEDAQASSLERQIRTTFASGCAGVFTYAWTDEWHRAARTSTIGSSDSPGAIGRPSRRWHGSHARTVRCRSAKPVPGRESPSWSVPTTARAPCATASTV